MAVVKRQYHPEGPFNVLESIQAVLSFEAVPRPVRLARGTLHPRKHGAKSGTKVIPTLLVHSGAFVLVNGAGGVPAVLWENNEDVLTATADRVASINYVEGEPALNIQFIPEFSNGHRITLLPSPALHAESAALSQAGNGTADLLLRYKSEATSQESWHAFCVSVCSDFSAYWAASAEAVVEAAAAAADAGTGKHSGKASSAKAEEAEGEGDGDGGEADSEAGGNGKGRFASSFRDMLKPISKARRAGLSRRAYRKKVLAEHFGDAYREGAATDATGATTSASTGAGTGTAGQAPASHYSSARGSGATSVVDAGEESVQEHGEADSGVAAHAPGKAASVASATQFSVSARAFEPANALASNMAAMSLNPAVDADAAARSGMVNPYYYMAAAASGYGLPSGGPGAQAVPMPMHMHMPGMPMYSMAPSMMPYPLPMPMPGMAGTMGYPAAMAGHGGVPVQVQVPMSPHSPSPSHSYGHGGAGGHQWMVTYSPTSADAGSSGAAPRAVMPGMAMGTSVAPGGSWAGAASVPTSPSHAHHVQY